MAVQALIDDFLRDKDSFWWGRHPDHGWVVKDYTDGRVIRCNDWMTICIRHEEFASRRFQWFKNYIYGIAEERKKIEALNELTALKTEFLAHRAFVNELRASTQYQCSKTAWSPWSIYKAIDNLDRHLAKLWKKETAFGENIDAVEAKMLSARCAEKVAMLFYQQIGEEVKDISAKQMKGGSDEWKRYDLLVGQRKPVDVKNARPLVNQKNRYLDYCVPQFKNARGEDVKIAGILSPYLNLKDMLNIDNICYSPRPITFLGETDYSIIRALEAQFSRNSRIAVTIAGKQVIPFWVFEFPPLFYAMRNKKREELRKQVYTGSQSIDELIGAGLNPICAFLSAGIPLPRPWENRLSEWQRKLYGQLLQRREREITMPLLFLNLLTHFLETASQQSPASDYDPAWYRQLLYSGEDECDQWPIGVYDPLGHILDFISTLEVLWTHRATIQFVDYDSFSFNGLGLLVGVRKGGKTKETILAYCGGYVMGKGKCGYSPLVMGKHETCRACRKLVCPKCDCCTPACQRAR